VTSRIVTPLPHHSTAFRQGKPSSWVIAGKRAAGAALRPDCAVAFTERS
jgi:hypothetical protein